MRLRLIPRRDILIQGAGLAASAGCGMAQASPPTLTAGDVVGRIKANVGIPWREQTVDRIIAGNPDTAVKGIATTMMATLPVLRRAAAAGLNLVITHEPTFYSHLDEIDPIKDDPVYLYKADFLRKNDMVSFRFHDHWHGHRPDGIAFGMARELGWQDRADPQNPRLFRLSPTPLSQLAREIQARLKIRTLRVVGDPKLSVSRVMASWGYVGQFPGITLLARPDVDLLIGGEAREWELVEYAQDAIEAGKRKALILMGHVVSEQAGMKYCAEWLKSFLPNTPIQFVPAEEPFWRPDDRA